MHFESMEPTEHYLMEHSKDVPWEKVIEIILTTKNPKKKGNKFEIKNHYYILFTIENKTLYVINAKKLENEMSKMQKRIEKNKS